MQQELSKINIPKRVAIVGTQGVPARYGGFESLVENLLGENCPPDVEYTVFCSGRDMPEHLKIYKGARLKYVPLKANGAQSVIYDAVSLARCLKGYDTILILGVSGCWSLPFFRLLTRSKLVINIDGLEHSRKKWKSWIRKFLRLSERMAIRYADVIIADNKGIKDYVTGTYGKSSELIAYGGDHSLRCITADFEKDILKKYGSSEGMYAIAVCRIEPENNSRLVLEAFSRTDFPLLYIGNWNHSEYSRKLKEEFSNVPNLHLVNGIYDLDVLYVLRKNAGVYIHGHSAGGTNPSLVEAMCLGLPVIAFDVVYNRETTENRALYFKNADDLTYIIKSGSRHSGKEMAEIAARRYKWDIVARQYVDLF